MKLSTKLKKVSENNKILKSDINKKISSVAKETPIRVESLRVSLANINGNQNNISSLSDEKLIGGFRVVSTITQRNDIDCCFRELGMVVLVVGEDLSFNEYILKGEDICSNEGWELITIDEAEVLLKNDYSELDAEQLIRTQEDLNKTLKKILLTLENDKYYVHDQSSVSSVWIISHNMDKKPSVTVVDTANTVVEGQVNYIDDNKLSIEFSAPFNGLAYLN